MLVLNPEILIGLEEFNQDFFDEIDKIENKISNGDDFKSIIQNLQTDITEVKGVHTKLNNKNK